HVDPHLGRKSIAEPLCEHMLAGDGATTTEHADTRHPRESRWSCASAHASAMELDPGIAPAVRILQAAHVPTYESCEGGPGHAFPEPTVRFRGNMAEGFSALATAIDAQSEIGLSVFQLRRVWRLDDGE